MLSLSYRAFIKYKIYINVLFYIHSKKGIRLSIFEFWVYEMWNKVLICIIFILRNELSSSEAEKDEFKKSYNIELFDAI